MNLKETIEMLDEEIEKKIMFGFKVRLGSLLGDKTFNPQREIFVKGNSTEEFMMNLNTQLKLLGEPRLDKKSEMEMWDKMSDLEMGLIAKQKMLDQLAN